MTTEQNIELFEKTTFDEFIFEWTDENGAAINISSYQGLMKILSPDGTTAITLNTEDTTGDRLIKDNAGGSLQPVFTDEHPLEKGVTYSYDMILYKVGETRRLARGFITVKEARTIAP